MEDLRNMQLEIVNMLKDVDKVLSENNIHYVLMGGSVLGAIRHKGFIPWDDDADIGVFRKDFEKTEKLLSELKQYTYDFADNHIIPDAPVGHLKLVNDNYKINFCPNIDVFPLDKVPSSKFKIKFLRIVANFYDLSNRRIPPKNRGKFNKIFFGIILKIVPNKIWDFIKKLSSSYIKNMSNKNYKNTGNIFGAWTEKEYFPTEIYSESVYADFENISLPIPKNYDFYLTQLYGNYMELPPEHKRIPKHLGEIHLG